MCDAARRALVPAGLPVTDFDEAGAFAALCDPGEFRGGAPARGRNGDDSLYVGLDRRAQGRAAEPRRPVVGHAHAHETRRAVQRAASAGRSTALSHERPVHDALRDGIGRERSADAGIPRAAFRAGDRAFSLHLADWRAADVRDVPARERAARCHGPLDGRHGAHGLGADFAETVARSGSGVSERAGNEQLRHDRIRAGHLRSAA